MYVQGMDKIMGIGSPFLTCVLYQACNTFCMSLEQIEMVQAVPYIGVFVLCIMNLWVKY